MESLIVYRIAGTHSVGGAIPNYRESYTFLNEQATLYVRICQDPFSYMYL